MKGRFDAPRSGGRSKETVSLGWEEAALALIGGATALR